MGLILATQAVYGYGYKVYIKTGQKRGSFFDGIDEYFTYHLHDYRNGYPPYFLLHSCTLNEIYWANLYGNKIFGTACKGTDENSDIWIFEANPYIYTGHTDDTIFTFKRWVYDKGMSGDQTPLENTVYDVYFTYDRSPAWIWMQSRYGIDYGDLLIDKPIALVTNLNGQRIMAFAGRYYPNPSLDIYWIMLTKDFVNFMDVIPLPTYSEVPTCGIFPSKIHYYSAVIEANVAASDGGAGSLYAGTYDVTVIPHYPIGYDTYGTGYGVGSTPYANVTIAVSHKIDVSWDAVSDANYYYLALKYKFTLPYTDVDTTNDLLTTSGHGFSNGQTVILSTSGTAPGGLTAGNTYYIRNKTSTTFQLSSTSTGAIINITSQGTGNHTFARLIWNYVTNTTNLSYTITNFPSSTQSNVVISGDFEPWSIRIGVESAISGTLDSDISQIAYRFNTTNSGSDTTLDYNSCSLSATVYSSSPTQRYYMRTKVKHLDGTWGDYGYYNFVYGDTPADVDTIFNGNKLDYLQEDLDNDGTYIYVLASCLIGTTPATYSVKIFKYDSSFVLQSTKEISLVAEPDSLRLVNGTKDFYFVYVTKGTPGRVFYRKASEDFNAEYEISLPDGYTYFIPDATILAGENDYLVTAVHNNVYGRCKFYAMKIGETGTVYDTDSDPCTQARLENDPYDKLGLWFNFSTNPIYNPVYFGYLTITELISKIYTLPIWGRIERH